MISYQNGYSKTGAVGGTMSYNGAGGGTMAYQNPGFVSSTENTGNGKLMGNMAQIPSRNGTLKR